MFVFLLNIPRSIFAQDSSKSKIPADAAICWRFQVLFKLRSSYWSWKWGDHCHKKMRSLSSVIGPNVILQFDHLFEWSSRNFNKKCVLQSFARVLINSQKKGKLFFHGVFCNHDLADKYQDYSRHYHYDISMIIAGLSILV